MKFFVIRLRGEQLSSANTFIGILFLILLNVAYIPSQAQIGGVNSFEFLHVPSSARLAGLGGVNVSLVDQDLSFVFSNPALTGDTLNGFASVNYQFFPGKIGNSSVVWQHEFNRVGSITMGVQHMNYGTIAGYDETGTSLGEFDANETALLVGKNHTVGNYRFGASLKGVFSNLAGYRSSALALDLGGVFKHPGQQLMIGLAIKNVGVVLSEYSATSKTTLPLDVQLGVTYKPEHMPLRFSLTAFNLTKEDVSYYDSSTVAKRIPALEKVLSHFNFGGEFILSKNVSVLVAYNYFNHRALKLENGGRGAGLSLGFSARIKSLDFVFSRMAYVAGKATYSFGLSYDLRKLLKRKTV